MRTKATIHEREEAIEAALLALRRLNSPELRRLQLLDILVPEGFRPVVELTENGRTIGTHKIYAPQEKRRDVPADNWSPSDGEVHIRFERVGSAQESARQSQPVAAPSDEEARAELLKALQDAESTPGRMFVALKWFRDEYLPSTGLGWAQNREECQAILAKSIADGWILTSKVPNPKAPLYPTTTIRVNRQKLPDARPSPASRFRPVPISGEPLSTTILRERGLR
jgi:hypothetical protein